MKNIVQNIASLRIGKHRIVKNNRHRPDAHPYWGHIAAWVEGGSWSLIIGSVIITTNKMKMRMKFMMMLNRHCWWWRWRSWRLVKPCSWLRWESACSPVWERRHTPPWVSSRLLNKFKQNYKKSSFKNLPGWAACCYNVLKKSWMSILLQTILKPPWMSI